MPMPELRSWAAWTSTQIDASCSAAARYGRTQDVRMKKQIVTAALMASVVYFGISASVESGLFRKAVEYGRAKKWIVVPLSADVGDR
ncbi:hypothetical protein DB771_01995 [Burkholderia sp. AU29985]|nr:hypothetical protein XM57_22135 [Burkholderia cepacia]AYZ94317.1 hypothetical protein EGY28_04095 [Burkholderia dolosa]ETP63634.1 hypothetical protein BDSB_15935 [Burkholderia dolosa PC543]PRE39706.1 hypothetical protein C6P87_29475 [Burkholderia sp. AU12872]PUA78660.1 hypothetical protein DB771_01995 [Burkholderia sp. AU29985]